MIRYYLTENGILRSVNEKTSGCWISVTDPSGPELAFLAGICDIDGDALAAALDPEERSHIETADTYTMILVNIPIVQGEGENESYDTIPLAIFLIKDTILTVCERETALMEQFAQGRVPEFHTAMKSRFVLQILFRAASQYLQYLRRIDKRSDTVEEKLKRSTKNRELIELLRLEKSLVYFTASLRSNEAVLEKLLRLDSFKKYPEDEELLRDVIVENKQAIEMASVYRSVLNGTMDCVASMISGNLNNVMKTLSVVTIVMAVPTMIFSAYGMNVNAAWMPFSSSPYAFPILLGISAVLAAAAAILLAKMRPFR